MDGSGWRQEKWRILAMSNDDLMRIQTLPETCLMGTGLVRVLKSISVHVPFLTLTHNPHRF